MSNLTIEQYQSGAESTAIYPGMGELQGLTYTILGLNGEAGEVAEKLKKSYRDDGFVTEERRQALIDELGDVAWYLAMTATELGVDLESVMERNLEKLLSRQERNVISGDGDNR